MHVAISLLSLVPGEPGGLDTYARELIPRLVAHDEVHVTCLVSERTAATGGPWGDIAPVEVVPAGGAGSSLIGAEQRHVARIAARIGADLVHDLGITAAPRGDVARVTTVHDLHAAPSRRLVRAAVRRSHLVIVPSDATKRDLVEHFGTGPRKIEVVPEAANAAARVLPTPAAEVRAALGLGDRPVVLCIGPKRPHKNIPRVLEALALLPQEGRPALVLSGHPAAYDAELRSTAERLGIAADVCFAGWVSASDLEGLYGLATLVALPSLHEGFGLPVLEAMSRGVPVVTANRSAMPEVAGGAALLVDPERTEAIADAIGRLLDDPQLRAELAEKGIERARRFTWERTAELTVYCYKRGVGIKQLGLD